MIFSILSSFVTAFSPKECFLRPYLLGLIEMTTGIREMASSCHPDLLIGAGMTGSAVFGGLSGIFQVSAVIKKKCRTFHPALCTVEAASPAFVHGSVYSAVPV